MSNKLNNEESVELNNIDLETLVSGYSTNQRISGSGGTRSEADNDLSDKIIDNIYKIKGQIKASLEDSIHRSKRTTRFKGVKEQQFEDKVWNRINLRDGFVKYELNKENPLYKLLSENLSETDKRLLDSFIFQIETGLPKYSIQNDTLDDLKIVNDSDSNTPEELIERVCKDLECVPSSKKEAILDELLKTDVYKSISDKRDLIIERIGVYV